MSPARSDDPLRRVTLNLYEADIPLAQRIYGHGWTTNLREMWHQWLAEQDRLTVKLRPRTLGDLEE